MLKDLFKRPRHLVQQSVECMFKQMLEPFKQACTSSTVVVGDWCISNNEFTHILPWEDMNTGPILKHAYSRLEDPHSQNTN